MKVLAALVALSLVVAISGHSIRSETKTKDKVHRHGHGDKIAKAKMAMAKCLNPATANASMAECHQSMVACAQELTNQTGEALDRNNREAKMKFFKKNHARLFACKWQKAGLLTVSDDGTATFQNEVVAQFADRFNETAKVVFADKIKKCVDKKSLPSTFTLGADSKGIKPYEECFKNAFQAACGKEAWPKHGGHGKGKGKKADGSSTMSTPTESNESDEFVDVFDDEVLSTTATP